jgi:hypothetical protein
MFFDNTVVVTIVADDEIATQFLKKSMTRNVALIELATSWGSGRV